MVVAARGDQHPAIGTANHVVLYFYTVHCQDDASGVGLEMCNDDFIGRPRIQRFGIKVERCKADVAVGELRCRDVLLVRESLRDAIDVGLARRVAAFGRESQAGDFGGGDGRQAAHVTGGVVRSALEQHGRN